MQAPSPIFRQGIMSISTGRSCNIEKTIIKNLLCLTREASSDVMVKPLLKALAGETVRPAPFWLMRQAGRYLPEYRKLRASADSFLDLCFSPALAAEITLQPVRRFETDAAILFSDILTIPHAMGQKVQFVEGRGPVLGPFEPAALQPVGGRLDPVYEAVRLVRAGLPGDTALIGFAGAPWTVAAYMIEGSSSRDWLKVRQAALGEPDRFAALIDRLVEVTVDHLAAQAEAGAEALQLFDSWAGLLPPAAMRRWCLEPARRIAAALGDRHPSVPLILFPRGASALRPSSPESAPASAWTRRQTLSGRRKRCRARQRCRAIWTRCCLSSAASPWSRPRARFCPHSGRARISSISATACCP